MVVSVRYLLLVIIIPVLLFACDEKVNSDINIKTDIATLHKNKKMVGSSVSLEGYIGRPPDSVYTPFMYILHSSLEGLNRIEVEEVALVSLPPRGKAPEDSLYVGKLCEVKGEVTYLDNIEQKFVKNLPVLIYAEIDNCRPNQ